MTSFAILVIPVALQALGAPNSYGLVTRAIQPVSSSKKV